MDTFLRYTLVYFLAIFVVTVTGQKACEDFSPDPSDCTKFIRCFYKIRIKFTCPPGTAWENELKTCVWKEYVESCGEAEETEVDIPPSEPRLIGDSDDSSTYEANALALMNVPIGRTIAEARALGPIVTPKQYQCSYCIIGQCAVVVNTVQCYCGNNQCPPAATTPIPQPRNPCLPNPCLNGGQCISQGAGFICNCPSTYTGNRCEAPAANPCQPNPCQNGGACQAQGNSFACRCPPMYIGRCCEIRLTTTTPFNPCAPNPCLNGAQCIPTGSSNLCQCPQGFYGQRCESRSYCMPNPCANNGICTQTTSGYICACSYPYTGTNCQQVISTTTTTTLATRAPCGNNCGCIVTPCPTYIIVNPCVPNPCQNMGGCAVQNNAAQCYCTNSYTGYYCQFLRTGRSLPGKVCNKTCLNGGQCYFDEQRNNQPRCSCPNEYYGAQCELKNGPKSCSPKNPCMNKAKCITTKSGPRCVCEQGTSGILCEKVIRAKNQKYCPLDCQAGGTCVYVRSQPQCRCPKSRTGRLCETKSGKSLSSDDIEQ